jgi:L-lactate utilization protein LutC
MVWEACGYDAIIKAVEQAWYQLAIPDPSVSVWPVIYWVNPELQHIEWSQILQQYGPVKAWEWGSREDMRQVATTAVLGITGCAWAVAVTGSVALYASETTGLWPSILPPAHLVLVARQRIVRTVAEGLRQMAGAPLPPLFKIVTGPSMTADIEGTLVIGVHGPGRVGAIVYDV